ncbi:oligosaccharide repeat unit polymerase [Brevundimonas sp.]|uniref:oligosaccharide repeat unit polymerase n=1 Tax=Brevundimonas sp. TaxID=1871086 RepID=UPI002ED8A1A3
MKFHPAALMLLTWIVCIAVFLILPFRLEGRVLTLYGFLILAVFIGTFCVGALAASRPQLQQPRSLAIAIDWRLTDRVLITAAAIAGLASILDVQGSNLFDLAEAYQVRSDRAGALLAGGESESTIWFQIAFLTYPAGYIYLIREIGFRPKPVLWRVGAFGLLPVVLTSLAMGGRAPLFYAFLMLVFGYLIRRHVFPDGRRPARQRRPQRAFKLGPASKAGIALVGVLAAIYFVQVFFARADIVGGVEGMFGVAELTWGVSFNGHMSDLYYGLLGADGTYLVFIFAWYMVQGLVMSNALFSDYDGPMMLGAYGVDLVSALMRRINGEFIADGFAVLLHMNTYGFLPSAFGSLFVDFKFFGLIPCLIWGWLAGKVYGEIKRGKDPRWLMVGPFITLGIFFSLINTPIGFSNGFVTHLWLVVAFLAAKVRIRAPVQPPVHRRARPA